MSVQIKCIGYASGIAARERTCERGPAVIQKDLAQNDQFVWVDTLHPETSESQLAATRAVAIINEKLAFYTHEWTLNHQRFLVIGGDHTCAIGTWSGVASALQNDIGLIWIDAHMDSHTPETSHSKNLHGMPLAVLLGYGDERLTHIQNAKPKVLPQNICLIGVRSFEEEEAAFLRQLGVRIFFMPEVQERGFDAVFEEAKMIVNQDTVGYGISLDIDAFDPLEAPGTGAQEPNGIRIQPLLESFQGLNKDQRWLGLEIVEFDPHLDEDQQTEKLILKVIDTVFK